MKTLEIILALIRELPPLISKIIEFVRKFFPWLTLKTAGKFLLNVLWVTALIYLSGRLASLLVTPSVFTLMDHNGKYVTALDANSGWAIKASSDTPTRCSHFTLVWQDRANHVAALKTCYKRYITAMDGQQGWKLTAETKEVKAWEKFTLIDLGNNQVALKSFHDRYITSMNNQPGWDWELIGETKELHGWEKFEKIAKPWISISLAAGMAFIGVAAWYLFPAWKRRAIKEPSSSESYAPPNRGSSERRGRRPSHRQLIRNRAKIAKVSRVPGMKLQSVITTSRGGGGIKVTRNRR